MKIYEISYIFSYIYELHKYLWSRLSLYCIFFDLSINHLNFGIGDTTFFSFDSSVRQCPVKYTVSYSIWCEWNKYYWLFVDEAYKEQVQLRMEIKQNYILDHFLEKLDIFYRGLANNLSTAASTFPCVRCSSSMFAARFVKPIISSCSSWEA